VSDRRYERRMPKSDPVELRWRDADGALQSMTGRLFDLSPSGACVIANQPVHVLSAVTLTHNGHEFAASVRYAKRCTEGYMIGVEFDAPPTLP